MSDLTRDETLAVVIPTYNRAVLVKRAIESVLAQTHPADEIVVVDDGSTDDTAEVLAGYPQVRLIQKQNGGLSSARNAGIGAANSTWIALLDDDDWYTPEMLERQHELLRLNPELDVVYTATHRVDGTGKVLGRSHIGHRLPLNPLASLAVENFVLSSAVRVRRKLFVEAGMFDTAVSLCEDQDMWIRVASLGARFGYVDEPLAFITRQPGSMSANGERMARATLEVLERRQSCLEALRGPGGRRWWLANAHYRLGRVYWEAGNYDCATIEFASAGTYDPAHRGAKIYAWAAADPRRARVFIAVRTLKRAAMSLLQKSKLVEARWG